MNVVAQLDFEHTYNNVSVQLRPEDFPGALGCWFYEVVSIKLGLGNEMDKNFDKQEITESQKYWRQIITVTFNYMCYSGESFSLQLFWCQNQTFRSSSV